MDHKSNPRQLVLRRDTATGLTLVGWASDLPIGRFEHLELIFESTKNILPGRDSQYFESYQLAIRQALEANSRMLALQVLHNRAQGWCLVPFDLAKDQQGMKADNIGNFAAAAMQLQYQLTRNCKQAWVIFQQESITHVRARYPKKSLDELTFQVWYHKQLSELKQLGGAIVEGDLMVCESGLWFAPQPVQGA